MTAQEFENLARGLLWVVVALGLILVPVGFLREQRPDPQLAALQAKLDEALDKKPRRFQGIGRAKTAINYEKWTGEVWFTNVSARSGFSCLVGTVTNSQTAATATSLADCEEVHPYSSVHASLQFGGDFRSVCPEAGQCTLGIAQAEEVQEPPTAPPVAQAAPK